MNSVVVTYRRWIGFVSFALASLLLLSAVTVWAAPLPAPRNQTVPPPTLTSASTAVPTATASSRHNSNNDNGDDKQESPTATPTPLPEAQTATVNVPRLNVREGPGTNYLAIGVVTSGETLRVLARNEVGDWWRVCCLSNTTTAGWVASQYLQPNFDLGQLNTLIPLAPGFPTPPSPTAVPTLDPAGVPTPVAGLQLQISQMPLYTWQGEAVTLVYLIVNNGDAAVTDLELRNELPPQLHFVAVEDAGGGTVTTENLETGPAIFTVQWPTLAAGARTTVQVQVRVAQDLPDGAVVDNLAVITAQDVAAVTAGISIGMPPTTLPEFR